VPARDVGRIGVYEIIEIARQQRSGHLAPRNLPIPPVDRILHSMSEACRQRCGDLTLRDLIDEPWRPALHLTTRQSSQR
jgi:hypothetical protein